MGWMLNLLPGHLLISLNMIDLSKVFEKVLTRPHGIELSFESLTIPDVSLQVGRKKIAFDREKVQTFLLSSLNDFKKSLLDLINLRMKDTLANVIEDKPKEIRLSRIFPIDGDLKLIFGVQDIQSQEGNILRFDLDSRFCDSIPNEECLKEPPQAKVRRTITPSMHQASLDLTDNILKTTPASIVVSVGEDYFNQVILATMKSGRWDEAFKGKQFRLGPEGAFVLADTKGDTFTLYLDIIQTLKRSQQIIVGKKEIRFPVRMQVGAKLVSESSNSRFRVKVERLNTDAKIIINGLPDLGLPSTVGEGRFQQKVIQTILEDIREFDQQNLLDLSFESYLESVVGDVPLHSDGMGRGHAILYLHKN
jgi:hypothetical protein